MDDLQFYENNLLNIGEEDQSAFFKRHPEFLDDCPLNPIKVGRGDLLMDATFRGIMKKIKHYEESINKK